MEAGARPGEDIEVRPGVVIPDSALEERFVRASGPGGQHVNKTSSAVQLRFDAARSGVLPPDALARLRRLAGRRMTEEGVIVIEAERHRSQEANRRDARERLRTLVAAALERPRPRRPTRPGRGAIERRLREKRQRSERKRTRGRSPPEES